MKKAISLILALLLVCSMGTAAFADYATEVSYTGKGTEQYTVTIPALAVADGDTASSGDVTVTGQWASNKTLKVTCPTSVTLSNSLKETETKDLAVTFAGIEKTGNNTEVIAASVENGTQVEILVAPISGALFGTWSGTLTFTVTLEAAA